MYSENLKVNNQISLWLISMFWIISIMIVVGGLTRLTDSGLSITKWQLFSGFLPPLNKSEWISYFDLYKKIPEFKLQNYDMTMQEFKVIFWWEWAHRFMGRLIGLAFLIPLIYFTFKINFKKLIEPKWLRSEFTINLMFTFSQPALLIPDSQTEIYRSAQSIWSLWRVQGIIRKVNDAIGRYSYYLLISKKQT